MPPTIDIEKSYESGIICEKVPIHRRMANRRTQSTMAILRKIQTKLAELGELDKLISYTHARELAEMGPTEAIHVFMMLWTAGLIKRYITYYRTADEAHERSYFYFNVEGF